MRLFPIGAKQHICLRSALPVATVSVFLLILGMGWSKNLVFSQEVIPEEKGTDDILFQDPKEYLDDLNVKRKTILDGINRIQEELKKTQADRKGVEQEVRRLELQIKNLKLELKETELSIEEISFEIKQGEEKIGELSQKIVSEKEILEGLLRIIYENGDANMVEMLLKGASLSQFFDEIKYLESVQGELFQVIAHIKNLKLDLEEKREELEEERQNQFRLKAIQENNAAAIKRKEQTQKEALRTKQTEESLLKARLAESRKALEAIQRDISLFVLKGTEVTTGDIIRLVLSASQKTGIRPAFLLAVLEQESQLGARVGTGNWQTDMKDNQKESFLTLVQKLGLRPDEVPVSKQVFRDWQRVMWGGAVGPAQFLPSTWLIFEDQVAQITGNNPPSPWNMEDAVAAMALYLKRYGADDSSRENGAARAYVSGKPSCSSSVCATYARQVLNKAAQWEEYLASLKQ